MTEFTIDTKKKTLCLRLELVGEPEPIEIEITRYNLKAKGDQAQLTIEEAKASREWLSVAMREFVVGRSFTVPAAARAVLKVLT